MADNLQSICMNTDPDLTQNSLRLTIRGACILPQCQAARYNIKSLIGDSLPCNDMKDMTVISVS